MWPDVCWTWLEGGNLGKVPTSSFSPPRTTWKVVRGRKGPLTQSIGAAI